MENNIMNKKELAMNAAMGAAEHMEEELRNAVGTNLTELSITVTTGYLYNLLYQDIMDNFTVEELILIDLDMMVFNRVVRTSVETGINRVMSKMRDLVKETFF